MQMNNLETQAGLAATPGYQYDYANLTAAWRAVTEWFGNTVPPATLLGVSLLSHENQLVEIDATVISVDG